MQEHIWDPMGMEYSGEWIVDNTGVEMVLGGLNAALRDYAKLGLLYLHEGEFNGQKILSKDWVRMATTPDAPHLMPDQTTLSSNHHGYGFQWWIPQYDRGDFMAGGIYNQYIYVQPEKNLVITKLSANYHYKTQKHITKDIHIAMFQKMAEAF
jgi:CubicO group peptidase (beta-lactamase class C family)